MSWEVGCLLVSGVSAGVEARVSLETDLSRRESSQPSAAPPQSDTEKPKITAKKIDVSPILDKVYCWPLEKYPVKQKAL